MCSGVNFNTSYRWNWTWVKLTYGSKGDVLVFPGVNGIVVGPVSPHVRSAVDQPSGVQHQGVPQHSRDEVGHRQRLPPHVPRHKSGDKEAHEQHGLLVIPVKGTKQHRRQDQRHMRDYRSASGDVTVLTEAESIWTHINHAINLSNQNGPSSLHC